MSVSLTHAPLAGRIAYNGFVFGEEGATPPSYRLSGTPVYDEATRAVSHVRYTLEVSCLVYGASEPATAARLAEIRNLLTRPARPLELAELGLGHMDVQAGGNLPDVAWGARPRLLALEPIGGTQAWQLAWQCEFQVSEGAARLASGDWLSLTCHSEVELDDRGFATRTLRGAVTVVQIRQAGESHPRRSADEARDRLRLVVPAGFRRVKSVFRVSADQARLDFEVIDEQLRHDPFPPGIAAGELEFAVEQQSTSRHLVARLSGWLESSPVAPKSLAALHFLKIAETKRRQFAAGLGGRAVVAPSRLVVRHALFTRRTHFDFEFLVLRSAGELLALTAIWQPLPESDETQWRLSFARLWQNRGSAGLRPDLAEGAILDLVDHPARQAVLGAGASLPPTPAELPVTLGLAPRLAPEHSWLEYQVQVRVDRDEPVSLHSLAGANLSGAALAREVHGAPRETISLTGQAVRLGFPPVAPRLVTLGGRTVYERRRREQRDLVAWYDRTPAYRLKWTLVYDVLDGPLGKIELPRSPV